MPSAKGFWGAAYPDGCSNRRPFSEGGVQWSGRVGPLPSVPQSLLPSAARRRLRHAEAKPGAPCRNHVLRGSLFSSREPGAQNGPRFPPGHAENGSAESSGSRIL